MTKCGTFPYWLLLYCKLFPVVYKRNKSRNNNIISNIYFFGLATEKNNHVKDI